jgi:phage terminase large subunit
MQATTALRKISALKKRIWCIQGGQGAGKTFSICMLIANHASANPNKEIYIVSAELSKMRDTVLKDFIKILRHFNLYEKCSITGVTNGQPQILFPNKSIVRFIGLDKEDVGKGLRSDIIYFNEANKTNFESYREISSRAKRIILDYNPNQKFWAHTEVINDPECDYLCLTFQDNEFLSDEEKNTILSYKQKGYKNPDLENYDSEQNIKSKYWVNKWRIYGLGITGLVDNRIYENWKIIQDDEFNDLPYPKYYGLDFGSTNPSALVEVKFDGEKTFFAKEKLYLPISKMNSTLSEVLEGIKIDKSIPIVCDSADPLKISELIQNGFNAMPAMKGQGSVKAGIDFIQSKEIFYCKSSVNFENEYETYEWEIINGTNLDRPVKKDDHILDAFRYLVTFLQFYLGIK